jgi:hypothetical protein
MYTISTKHLDIMKNPYRVKFSQIAMLTALSVITIIADYSAIVGYT